MFTIAEILEATGGKLLQGSGKARVKGVSTDTRTIAKNNLFVAIKGENYDAHHFLDQALKKGAGAFLVSSSQVKGVGDKAVIVVDDTVKALGFLARFHRRRFPGLPLIAITGSAGKTTTKEMMAAVLKTKLKVHYNKGTENNHIGVPMTLLGIKASHQAAIIETGTNHPGEIKWLAFLVEPTVAVFTNIGASHLAGLGTPLGVLKEKMSLIDFTSPQGAVVVNADDKLLMRIFKRKLNRKVLGYGVSNKAKIRASSILGSIKGISFSIGQERFNLKTPVWGNVSNALAAIACARMLKLSFADIRKGLGRFKPPKGRQVFHKVKGVTVIDDTYNANPVSFKNAVQTLAAMKGKGRAVLVAADMLELGARAQDLHREVGKFAALLGVDALLTCGTFAKFIGEAALMAFPKSGPAPLVKHFGKQDEVLGFLKSYLMPGDVVLVKGSRGMRMENIIQGIITYLKG
ncbi:MAG: UDP-N-acetylmuramoyl-tripeptide--D-alanyl-D-alanine ligase [Candidatus Omnitrophica bacterium]|nr:UDP-N-acetylmuramoyl-tripeptide--D-alanyl-D-alanine ligase [Candidatus Omnitrophota bacterium]